MMGRKTARRVPVQKVHLKYIGVTQRTHKDYKTALHRFYAFVDFRFSKKPCSPSAMRFAASEFVNFLYQDDRPISWAGNFLSGMKRFHPSLKPSLDLAQQYHTNWSRSITRVRAFPFTAEVVQAMAVVLATDGKPSMAVVVLLAFIGLFRWGKIFSYDYETLTSWRKTFALFHCSNRKRVLGRFLLWSEI